VLGPLLLQLGIENGAFLQNLVCRVILITVLSNRSLDLLPAEEALRSLARLVLYWVCSVW
jgi:hypothetical protein